MRTFDGSELEAVATLGEGASGSVRAVRVRGSERLLARKPLQAADRRELNLLARLHHPHLVALAGWGEDTEGPFLLTELVDGGELQAALARGAAPEALLADALRALAFLHSRGLVHGDLKPQNLLVTRAGRLLVADLGLARAEGASEEGGTLAYMAPERLLGAPASAAGDIFALGASFAIALGAALPDDPRQASSQLGAWLDRASTPLAPLLREFVRSAPADRPSSVRLAARRLANLLSNPALARETAESSQAYLRPAQIVGRKPLLASLQDALAFPGVVLLRASPGAGATRVVEELALTFPARLAAGGTARPHEGSEPILIDDGDAADERLSAWLIETQRRTLEAQAAAHVLVCVRPESALEKRLLSEGARAIDLPPLDESAVCALVSAAYPDRGDPKAFSARLREVTGGAPARVLAVLSLLSTRGLAQPGALVDHDLPAPEGLDGLDAESLATALDAHLRTLLAPGSDERLLAALLSIASTPMRADVLRAAWNGQRTVADAAAKLRAWGILSEGSAWTIDGAQQQRAVRALLSSEEVTDARRALARGLSKTPESAEPEEAARAAAQLARLSVELADPKASRLARDAAARLESLSLPREASALLDLLSSHQPLAVDDRLQLARCLAQVGEFDRALTEARASAGERPAEAALLIAEVFTRRGDYASVVADLDAARERGVRSAELDALLARALALSGKHERALEVADAALAHSPSPAAAIDLTATAALALFYKGDLDAASLRYQRAQQLARTAGDRVREANATNGLGLVAQRRAHFDEARERYAEALEIAENCGDRARVGTSHLNLGTVLQELGRSREAAQEYRRSASVARLIGERVQSARARSNLANLLIYVGRLDEALGAAQEARELALQAGAGVVQGYAVLLLGDAALLAGRSAEAHARLTEARTLFLAMGNASEALEADLLLARHALWSGEVARARVDSKALAERARSQGLDRHEAQAWLLHAEVLLQQGEAGSAVLAAAHRALGLALPGGRPDLLWRIESALARGASDESAQTFHARQALARLDLALQAVDAEDRVSFAARADRARLKHLVTPLMRGAPERGADARLQRLLSINRRLGAERNLKTLLDSLVDQAVELCGAERGFVLLAPEKDGAPLDVMVARNIDGESLAKGQLKVSHSIAERVIREGEPELTLDAQEDERYQKQLSVAALKLRSVLCVPLRFQGKVLGALYLDNRFRARAFGPDDLSLLEAFADQATIALAQVRALEDARQARELADKARAEIEQLNRKLEDKVVTQEAEIARARREADEQRLAVARTSQFSDIVGDSAPMRRLLRQLERVAATDLTVLVTGESGTGKELIARALFSHGPRRDKAFVSVNCGAISEGILESELFGHVRGAFTGADRERDGLFQVAHGGTLFLDEVGDMGLSMQVKLLRALQEGEIRKVGGKEPVKVDVRVIAATNRDLVKLMQEGRFREDLYYRLNVVSLQLPPLRERLDDLPALCARLLSELPGREGKPFRLAQGALLLLQRHPWQGNIRELRATLHNAALFADGSVLDVGDFAHKRELFAPAPERAPVVVPTAAGAEVVSIEQLELDAIQRTLQITGGNKSETARRLGIDRKTLYNKLAKLRKGLES